MRLPTRPQPFAKWKFELAWPAHFPSGGFWTFLVCMHLKTFLIHNGSYEQTCITRRMTATRARAVLKMAVYVELYLFLLCMLSKKSLKKTQPVLDFFPHSDAAQRFDLDHRLQWLAGDDCRWRGRRFRAVLGRTLRRDLETCAAILRFLGSYWAPGCGARVVFGSPRLDRRLFC
jgi:hypothetical protein